MGKWTCPASNAPEVSEPLMQDGATQIVDIKVECPKCRQESVVRVSTGNDVDTVSKSIVCAYCRNPWIEFLPGEQVGEPDKQPGKPRAS